MAIAIEETNPVTLAFRTSKGRVYAVPKGTPVIGSDKKPVGRLKAIDIEALLVSRSPRRGIYVPFDFIADVTDDGIVLTIPAEQVHDMHWRHSHRI